MELRHLVLIFIASLASAQEAVRHYPLDPEAVVTVTLAVDAPTTCVFPGPLTALEGTGVAEDPAGGAPVLLSYREGESYFSLRAEQPDAAAGLNVVYAGQVYPLRLVTGPVTDRTVTFQAKSPASPGLAGLIARAQTEAYRTRPPGAAMAVPFRPGTATHYRNFSAVLEAVYRYEAENALVCQVRLENPGIERVVYDASGLGLRLDRRVWFASTVNASGSIPPGGSAEAWFVVRTDLTAAAPFTVIVPVR